MKHRATMTKKGKYDTNDNNSTADNHYHNDDTGAELKQAKLSSSEVR